MVAYRAGFAFTHADFRACSIPRASPVEGCRVEIPEVGYLEVATDGHGADSTRINCRLAPREGIQVRWSAREITIVDLDRNTAVQKPVLETTPVVGGLPFPRGSLAVTSDTLIS